jgi:hypothetical protein
MLIGFEGKGEKAHLSAEPKGVFMEKGAFELDLESLELGM